MTPALNALIFGLFHAIDFCLQADFVTAVKKGIEAQLEVFVCVSLYMLI